MDKWQEVVVVKWQPIETAPRDRTKILVACDAEVFAATWCDSFRAFCIDLDGQPLREATHWMPLPKPPTLSNDQEGS